MKAGSKRYWEMTTEELAKATAEFDRENIIDEFRALTPEERQLWERAKRKPDRPRVGGGAQVISITIEKRLLEQADRLARSKRLSRSRLIARGLRAVLAAEGEL